MGACATRVHDDRCAAVVIILCPLRGAAGLSRSHNVVNRVREKNRNAFSPGPPRKSRRRRFTTSAPQMFTSYLGRSANVSLLFVFVVLVICDGEQCARAYAFDASLECRPDQNPFTGTEPAPASEPSFHRRRSSRLFISSIARSAKTQ